ncbi:ABC transporter ATP-binding protein [Tannockella kyphosi]|uniref:ABC transporter ATP-binding protein n=1 Tax=Tannockella kyphosi TaxID=2899121 RepID=UPI002011D994|nr:ATP-binding cassette domain-containing protein [Tannockella kyphosi]
MKIIVNNLTKTFDECIAVDDLSFTIEKGTIVGFVGKNGAGKSTTIRCLMDFIHPSKGSCHFDHLDANKNAKKVRDFVGYMPSDTMFYPHITSRALFEFVINIGNHGLDTLDFLANYFELDLDKKIAELSLGNRKKVSIIQLLLKDKDVLILDEPTNGLDPFMQEKFFQLLLKEKEKGKTIFLSSHNLSEIEKYCDRALIIKDGKIVEDIDMLDVSVSQVQIVSYLTSDNKEVSYEYSGNPNDLIKELALLDLSYLEIRKKTVEESFIQYYKEEE